MKNIKLRVLSIAALVIGVSALVTAFNGGTVHAVDGNFRWTDPGTIHADNYGSDVGGNDFTGTMPTYKGDVSQPSTNENTVVGCRFVVTITVDTNNPSKATVKADGSQNSALDGCDMFNDKMNGQITIANAERGPPATDYRNINCADGSKNGGNQPRCEAIKACVSTPKAQEDCAGAYDTCIANYTTDNKISDENKKKCSDLVSKGDIDGARKKPDDKKSTCQIDGIGWIICPVYSFLGKVVDGAYNIVAAMLTVQPLVTTGNGSNVNLYNAWQVMRNFANVAFVIAFLVIIFSQVTSVGITNYGIKKMLPRLIVAAILVNVSYWVCAIAIDLSNIIGSSIKGLFDSQSATFGIPANKESNWATGQGWQGIVGGVLAGAGLAAIVLYITVSALGPALVLAMVAIVTVLLVLVLRQALIVLAVIISPLAFVAYLLPNTENLFKKWRELFQMLLLMFPIIGAIFGASALASQIVMTTAPPGGSPDKEAIHIAVQIMGAAIAIIPLAITPIIMRTTSGVLGKFGAFINNPNRGPFDRLKRKAEGYRDYRNKMRQGRALSGTGRPVFGGGRYKRAYRRDLRNEAADSGLKSAQAQFGVTDQKAAELIMANARNNAQAAATRNASQASFVHGVANNPGILTQGMGSAQNIQFVDEALKAQQEKAIAEAIKDVELSANISPGDTKKMADTLADAIKSGDSITARAMQNMLLRSGSPGINTYRKTIADAEGADPSFVGNDVHKSLRQNVVHNHSDLKGKSNDIMQQAVKGGNLLDHSNDKATWQGLSDDELAGQKKISLQFADSTGAIDAAQAKRILDSPELSKKLTADTRTILEDIYTRPAGTPPPPPPPI